MADKMVDVQGDGVVVVVVAEHGCGLMRRM